MFSVGEYVVYGGNGVCLIDGIGMPQCAAQGEKAYYFLAPVSYQGMIYAPVDGTVPMRRIMTGEEARALLCAIPGLPVAQAPGRDRRTLEDYYKRLLAPYTGRALAAAVKSIQTKRAGTRHPVTQTEENVLKRAAGLLVQELSLSLQVTEEQAALLMNAAMKGIA